MLRYQKLFLGGPCNNNCQHCPPDHRNSRQTALEDVRNALSTKTSPNIVCFGGEPTLRPDLLSIISLARQYGYRRIKLVSNGRALAHADYLDRIVNAGCSLFEIPLWGSTPELHDHLTRIPGSFAETLNGIGNLSEYLDQVFLCIRIPLCQENLHDLENTVVTALNARAHRLLISFWDRSLSYRSVLPQIVNSIHISIFNRVWIATEHLPLCAMQGLEHHVSEMYTQWDTLYPIAYRKDSICTKCAHDPYCPGVEADHVARFGAHAYAAVPDSVRSRQIMKLYEEKEHRSHIV